MTLSTVIPVHPTQTLDSVPKLSHSERDTAEKPKIYVKERLFFLTPSLRSSLGAGGDF